MKVIVYRNYVFEDKEIYGYGDDYSVVWNNLNCVEKFYELDHNEFNKLKDAVNFFNARKKEEYRLGIAVVADDDEVNSLLSDYNKYLDKEKARREKEAAAYEAKKAEAKAKREAKKADRDLERMAKKLNMSLDEFKKKISDK